jgi:hypothetical protein
MCRGGASRNGVATRSAIHGRSPSSRCNNWIRSVARPMLTSRSGNLSRNSDGPNSMNRGAAIHTWTANW